MGENGVPAYDGTIVKLMENIFVRIVGEWFCSYSPHNFSLTKSPVLKPAPGRISWNTAPLAAPTSSFDRPLQTRKSLRMLFSLHPSSCLAAMKRSLMKITGSERGYGKISPGRGCRCTTVPRVPGTTAPGQKRRYRRRSMTLANYYNYRGQRAS